MAEQLHEGSQAGAAKQGATHSNPRKTHQKATLWGRGETCWEAVLGDGPEEARRSAAGVQQPGATSKGKRGVPEEMPVSSRPRERPSSALS